MFDGKSPCGAGRYVYNDHIKATAHIQINCPDAVIAGELASWQIGHMDPSIEALLVDAFMLYMYVLGIADLEMAGGANGHGYTHILTNETLPACWVLDLGMFDCFFPPASEPCH